MPEKSENKTAEAIKTIEITFKCKLCGETKPFSELVIMRQYFPPLASCNDCSLGRTKVS